MSIKSVSITGILVQVLGVGEGVVNQYWCRRVPAPVLVLVPLLV